MALMTLLALKREHVALRRGVEMMINPDEEAGGENGAKWMVENHWDAIDPAFALNEGGSATYRLARRYHADLQRRCREKRVMWLQAHRARAGGTWLGADRRQSDPDPNPRARATAYSSARHPRDSPDGQCVPRDRRARNPPASFELDHLGWPFVLGYALRGPLHPNDIQALLRDTITPTMLSGSLKINVIPSTAEAGLDCRLLPGTDAKDFMDRMRALLNDDRITIDTFQAPDSPPPSPTSGKMWDAIGRVVAADFPGTYIVPWMTSGGTDSRFLREKGVPAYGFIPIVLTPAEERRFHGVDERLSVENLNRGIKATYDLAIDLCAAHK